MPTPIHIYTALFTFPSIVFPSAQMDALLKRNPRKLLMNKKLAEGPFELSHGR